MPEFFKKWKLSPSGYRKSRLLIAVVNVIVMAAIAYATGG